MSALLQALSRYVKMRRGFGYRYLTEERCLADFVAFMDAAQATVITRKLALAWITRAQRTSWPNRLSMVRGFARHLSNFEPETETPPAGVFPSPRRSRPYIYTEAEIERLLEATLSWGLAKGINRQTYHCLFGLLAATGMRLGEAIGLGRADVDLEAGLLTLRMSEIIQLERDAVVLGTGAHVRCIGKGRKERCTPLTRQTCHALQAWLKEAGQRGSTKLFPNIHGGSLSPDAVQRLLARHVETAKQRCASLARKRVTPHVLRHSAAMELLQAGVDCSVIALWLGHESIKTTQVYLHAHLALKEAALARVKPFNGQKGGRYKPADLLLAFLDGL
ncbi:MAG: tyrosine-type recombinase/integrase [Novosphingobium sp.]|nr:tyrosine-type recombinase/integrase [Novosphingobium sp.]